MRLTDIMSGAGLAGYAVIAMVIFIVAFVAVVIWIFRPSRRRELEADGEIPFKDGESTVKTGDSTPDNPTRGGRR